LSQLKAAAVPQCSLPTMCVALLLDKNATVKEH